MHIVALAAPVKRSTLMTRRQRGAALNLAHAALKKRHAPMQRSPAALRKNPAVALAAAIRPVRRIKLATRKKLAMQAKQLIRLRSLACQCRRCLAAQKTPKAKNQISQSLEASQFRGFFIL